jgi:hypothetical protein
MKSLMGLFLVGMSSAAYSQILPVPIVGDHLLNHCGQTRAGCPEDLSLHGSIYNGLALKLIDKLPEIEVLAQPSAVTKKSGAAITDINGFLVIKCQEKALRVMSATCEYYESNSPENLTVFSPFEFLVAISKPDAE